MTHDTWHPTDDDLILHFYGETGGVETTRLDDHLKTCGACGEAWAEWRATMQAIDAAAVPEPGDGFERVMWARVQAHLPVRRSWWSWSRLVPALGLSAAALVAGVIVWRRGVITPSRPAAPSAVVATATRAASTTPTDAHGRAASERVLLTALDDHFEESQVLLVELMNTPESGEADFGFARTTASDLVASGRLYRATARQNGNTQLAGMLDDLEAVLVDVARSPDRMDAADLASLRSRITDSRLLFKVRAVANEVRERQKTLSSSTE